jgi:uncharacterized protein
LLFGYLAIKLLAMNIKQTIDDRLKEAMKAKDETTLTVLRGIKTAFTNKLVADGGTPQDEISDEKALEVLKTAAKQRKDSIEQFGKGGRDDLIESEQKELAIIEEYLPETMGLDQIREVVLKKKEEMGVTDKGGMGQLMGAVMSELKGQADGGDVKRVVEEALS